MADILNELNAVYTPQRDIYNQQLAGLDPQQEAEIQGLEAAKKDAFAETDQLANRRGLFYSGIPIQEQQKYTGATFLPALANMRGKYTQQRFNLRDALAQLTQKQYEQAQGVREKELAVEEEARQFNERLAAEERARRAAASGGDGGASPSFNNPFRPTRPTQPDGGNGQVLAALSPDQYIELIRQARREVAAQTGRKIGAVTDDDVRGYLQLKNIPTDRRFDEAINRYRGRGGVGTGYLLTRPGNPSFRGINTAGFLAGRGF